MNSRAPVRAEFAVSLQGAMCVPCLADCLRLKRESNQSASHSTRIMSVMQHCTLVRRRSAGLGASPALNLADAVKKRKKESRGIASALIKKGNDRPLYSLFNKNLHS